MDIIKYTALYRIRIIILLQVDAEIKMTNNAIKYFLIIRKNIDLVDSFTNIENQYMINKSLNIGY